MNYFFVTFCLFLFCFLKLDTVTCEKSIPLGPGTRSKLKKLIEDDNDFRINIHAPIEDTQEVLESLDALMRIEEIQRKADEEEFVKDKQRLLKVHKKRIEDIVFAAFEPLHAYLPNPLQHLVLKEINAYMKKSIA